MQYSWRRIGVPVAYSRRPEQNKAADSPLSTSEAIATDLVKTFTRDGVVANNGASRSLLCDQVSRGRIDDNTQHPRVRPDGTDGFQQ